MCISNVDDLLFLSKDEIYIHDLANQLCQAGVNLEQECDAAGSSGVRIEQSELDLPDLIDALLLDVGTVNRKATLVKDGNGEVAHGEFSHISIVGILLYVPGHSHQDITCAVNCAAFVLRI